MRGATRRLGAVALAGLLVVPTGCASRSGWHSPGWEVGMMGAMIVGGLIVGGGLMHGGGMMGGGRAAVPDSALAVERFQPARLLELRAELELTDEQVTQLEVLRDDVAAERRTRADAARAAYELLRPVQRAAAASRAEGQPHHEEGGGSLTEPYR